MTQLDRIPTSRIGRSALLTGMIVTCTLGCGAYDGNGNASERLGSATQALDSDYLSPTARAALIISSLAVVNDGTRSNPNPCFAVPADAAKKWNFGYLMAQASSTAPTTTSASNYVGHWLSTWSTNQTINGQTVQPFGLGPFITGDWHTKSGSNSSYKMEYAPFRLSAIVPRFDLRKRRRFSEGLAGELRFVFGHVRLDSKLRDSDNGCDSGTTSGGRNQSTVILEYAVDKANENDVVAWAKSWADLADQPFGGAAYLSKLEALTESVVHAGKGSAYGRPNGSELIRIRTNENPNTLGTWKFREWVIDGTTKFPEPSTVKQTPMVSARNAGTPDVGAWANSNASAIRNDTYTVPLKFPSGATMRGGEDDLLLDKTQQSFWNVGFADNQVRHLFSLGTCSGCHNKETGGIFAQISARQYSAEAQLSPFLTGIESGQPATTTDPVTGEPRFFNEAEKRETDLLGLANGWPQFLPLGITTTNLSSYFKLVDVNTNRCLDLGGNSNGVTLQQWSCNGNANQRLTFVDLNNGYYNLRVRQGANNCLQAASAANSAGEWLVTQQACSTSTSQQVQAITLSSGYDGYQVRFRNSGRCLDLADANNGTKALQKACATEINASINQRFYLVE